MLALGSLSALHHTREYVFPVGYVVARLHQSAVHPKRVCWYRCSVLAPGTATIHSSSNDPVGKDAEAALVPSSSLQPASSSSSSSSGSADEQGPLFEVVCEDQPNKPFVDRSPRAVWARIADAIYALCPDVSLSERLRGVNGYERYGFDNPSVIALLQELPGIERCSNYQMRRIVRVQNFELGS